MKFTGKLNIGDVISSGYEENSFQYIGDNKVRALFWSYHLVDLASSHLSNYVVNKEKTLNSIFNKDLQDLLND